MDFAMSSTSQSVGRTIELFAGFARERRALSASEIAAIIAAPRSSCAALLKTLVDLDMVSVDRRTATYFPTARFAQLGAWISDGSIYPAKILEIMHELCAVTGETITLATSNDLMIELVQVERSEQAISFAAEKGQKFSLWGTGVGTAYLASLDNAQIRSLHRRCETRKLVPNHAPPIEDILNAAAAARRKGYTVAEGAVFADASAIAAPTPLKVNGRPLVVSIAGPTTRMKRRYDALGALLVERLRQASQE
jgi:DNA-binding IclR family transcriptional regulator